MRARLPNFFVLGAGRSGTTTLHFVLREHPEIFLPTPKEPTFFSEPFQVVRNPIRYAQLFRDAGDATAVGESSHAYLTHPEAAPTLEAFFPDARFIVVFRNPADRALAMYSYMVENGYEHHASFERALAAEDRRFASDRFARRCPHYFWNFMYFRSGLFGEQVQRYLDRFDRERFLFTTLYDLHRDPEHEFASIQDFLGVTRRPVTELPRYGSSKGVRSIPLQLLERTVVRRLSYRKVPLMAGARIRIDRWNRGTPPTMLPETHERLLERFGPDLERLRELTDVDVLGAQLRAAAKGTAGPSLPLSPGPRG